MNTLYQHTLKTPVTCKGVALHSGAEVTITLHPAEPDMGIVFKRLDLEGDRAIVVPNYRNVTETRLGTTITNAEGVSVSTIEHLMAALWGAGVDNAIVTLDAQEVPIVDGSSEPFMELIRSVGTLCQHTPRKFIEVLTPVEVKDGDSTAHIAPAGDFILNITIDFPHPAIGKQTAHYDFSDTTFEDTLARARTFGFVHEVEYLRSVGLARGGSLDNAIVLDKERVLNAEGLRYADEFLRHKALDCVGDYYLAGYRLRGEVTTYKPGHGINNKLLRALMADKKSYRVVEAIESAAPAFFVTATPSSYALARNA